MRAQLSEQDLTNYALNDGLDAHERLYVESMLGVSEECRNDVYKMVEMAQLLERGFELESGRTVPRLTRAQRTELLNAKPKFQVLPFVRKTAVALSMAACVAFVVANPAGWQLGQHSRTVAAVSSEVSRMVGEAMNADAESDLALWVTPQTVTDDDSTLIQTSGDGMPPAAAETICTPPSWKEAADTAAQTE